MPEYPVNGKAANLNLFQISKEGALPSCQKDLLHALLLWHKGKDKTQYDRLYEYVNYSQEFHFHSSCVEHLIGDLTPKQK